MATSTRFQAEDVEAYLEALLGRPARVRAIEPLGGGPSSKGYGYGLPLRIDYESGGRRRRAVLETVKPGPFGHEHMADRAASLLWAHAAFNELPGHVRSLDVGAVRRTGELVPLGDAEEFFQLTEFADGVEYARDLEGMGELRPLDLARADALASYLARIHRVKRAEPGLWARRLRELVGHGECAMGLADSYPPGYERLLEDVEHRLVEWRWRLKERPERLSQVHGDFHPWNLLFREGTDFTALDRSRGEWGEPADDVACLSLNYLFFSLRRHGRLAGAFEALFRRFWETYLAESGDPGVLETAAPFFAFRGLVMASPVWYPDLGEPVRAKLFDFMRRVLDAPRFELSMASET